MYKKGIKVIASTAIPQGVINQTIVSDNTPRRRDNGGTLRAGDRWWQPLRNKEYLFVENKAGDGSWIDL